MKHSDKKTSVIVINGRHYDAGSGAALAHEHQPAPRPLPSAGPAKHAAHLSRNAGHTATDLATAVQPAGAHGRHPAVHGTRHAAKHVAAHQPKPTATLMRQAVKKPAPALKRRIRVQAHLGQRDDAALHSRLVSRPPAAPARTHVRHHAVKGSSTQLISHFSPQLFSVVDHTPAGPQIAEPAPQPSSRPLPVQHRPQTTAELLEYAIQHAAGPGEPLPAPKAHHRKLFKHRARVTA